MCLTRVRGCYATPTHAPTHTHHTHTPARLTHTHTQVLSCDWTCFDATQYGTLMVVDPEEEYFATEVDKLQVDLEQRGLSLLVVADWYNPRVVERARFFDVSTRSWWTPITGWVSRHVQPRGVTCPHARASPTRTRAMTRVTRPHPLPVNRA